MASPGPRAVQARPSACGPAPPRPCRASKSALTRKQLCRLLASTPTHNGELIIVDPTQQAIALRRNGILTAFVILANCVKNNDAFAPIQLEDGLKATINALGANQERLDYQIMQNLLARLEGQSPPPLRVIPGGKTD